MSQRVGAMFALALAVLCASTPAEARRHNRRAPAAAHDDSVIALRRVAPGETWVVRQSTHLKKLVIAEGGRIEAPPGRTLTLAVNGVGLPVAPGTYAGDVTLNVPLELRLRDPGLEGEHPRAALYVYSGLFLPEKSAAALLVGGRVGNGSAADFSLASSVPDLTGAVFAGDARYALSGARLAVAGPGLLVVGGADVTVGGSSRIEAGGTALRLAGIGSSVLLDGAYVRAGNGLLAEFLPASHAALRIRAARVEGDVLYAPEGATQATLALEGAVLVGAVRARAPESAALLPGNALSVAIDGRSRWVVTRSSRLSALTLEPGAVVVAPEGAVLALYVDGEPAGSAPAISAPAGIAPGSYRGQLELRVVPAAREAPAAAAPVATSPAEPDAPAQPAAPAGS
jgi:hypothetical protein